MADINEELRQAVKEDNLSKVRQLLAENADPNYQQNISTRGGTCSTLHFAVFPGYNEIVQLLLEYGGDPNIEDERGRTPIFDSAMGGFDRHNITKLLLQHGADVNHVNSTGETALLYLIEHSHLPFPELEPYIKNISNVDQRTILRESLMHLVKNIHPDEDLEEFQEDNHFCREYLDILYTKGHSVHCLDDEGCEPLHSAASVACCVSLDFFLKKGALVNTKNLRGETALHYLAECFHQHNFSKSLDLLIENGMHINEADVEGRTALHHMVSSDSVCVAGVKEFMQKGASVDIVDILGCNIIHINISKNSEAEVEVNTQSNCNDVLQLLVGNGIDVNAADIFGVTPLHMAATRKSAEVVETLLALGSDITKCTKTGENALHRSCARFLTAPVILNKCYEENIDINVKDNYGSTPLHWAIWFREDTVLEMLLTLNADVNIKDASGKSALDMAEILKYSNFHRLIKFPNHEGPEKLLKSEGEICPLHGTDMFEECPLVGFIEMKNGKIGLEEWKQHLVTHRDSLKSFTSTILDSRKMGLYFDLEENEIIPMVIDDVIHGLCEYVSKSDPLFMCDVALAGSMFEGTKVDIPNEYDYTWNLRNFQNKFQPVESSSFPHGYIMLQATAKDDPDYSSYIDKHGYLDGTKVNQSLYSIINRGLVNLFQENKSQKLQCLYIGSLLDSADGGLSSLTFKWIGSVMKYITISIDIVPTIIIQDWIPKDFKENKHMILKEMVEKPQFPIVMKNPDLNFAANYSFLFRISYANMERSVIRGLPQSVIKGFTLVKAILESRYFPELIDEENEGNTFDILTTYKMKTCFLYELEKAMLAGDPSINLQKDAKLQEISLDWANRIIRHMEQAIKNQKLYSFFEPSQNLLSIDGSEIMFNFERYNAFIHCLRELFTVGTS